MGVPVGEGVLPAAAAGTVPELCPCPQLRDLQEKYAECGGMLQEAQEEVKSLRSRSLPNSTVSRYGAPSLLPVVSGGHGWGAAGGMGGSALPSADSGSPCLQGSLAAEIKGTMRKGTDSSSSDYRWGLASVAGQGGVPGGWLGGPSLPVSCPQELPARL